MSPRSRRSIGSLRWIPRYLPGSAMVSNSDHLQGESPGPRLCRAAAELLRMDGVAIVLRGDDGGGSIFGRSDDVVGRLEDLQFTLGEGPGIDAHTSGRAVFEPHLAESTLWPVFAPAAEEVGMLACFAFPLSVGAIRLGALDLYRGRSGSLTDQQGNRRPGARGRHHPNVARAPGPGGTGRDPG